MRLNWDIVAGKNRDIQNLYRSPLQLQKMAVQSPIGITPITDRNEENLQLAVDDIFCMIIFRIGDLFFIQQLGD